MKRFIAPVFALALLFTAFIFSSPRSQAQAGLVSSVLARMEANYNSLKTLRSTISMAKYNSQTRESDQYDGFLYMIPLKGRAANVRLDWKRPAEEYILSKDGKYTYFRPKLRIAYTGKTAQAAKKDSGALSFINMSGSQLKANYNTQVVGNENVWSPNGDITTTKLYLTPKAKAGYKSAEVWVDGSGMPVQIKITENNDDNTVIRL